MKPQGRGCVNVEVIDVTDTVHPLFRSSGGSELDSASSVMKLWGRKKRTHDTVVKRSESYGAAPLPGVYNAAGAPS